MWKRLDKHCQPIKHGGRYIYDAPTTWSEGEISGTVEWSRFYQEYMFHADGSGIQTILPFHFMDKEVVQCFNLRREGTENDTTFYRRIPVVPKKELARRIEQLEKFIEDQGMEVPQYEPPMR